MAAARLLLLALSVALFAAVWSGDRPRNGHSTRIHTAQIRSTDARKVSVSRDTEPTGCDPWASESALSERWQRALPIGVPAGEYLLAETTGQTQRVTLTAEMLQSLGHDPDVRGEPIYTLTAEGQTAYLIRVTPPDRIAARKQ